MLPTQLPSRYQFKLAMLCQGVEEGLDEAGMTAIAKTAADQLEGVGLEKQALALPSLGAVGGFLGNAGLLAAGGLGLAGTAAGRLGAAFTNLDDRDVHEVQQNEMLQELNRLSEELERNNAVRLHRQGGHAA